MSGPRAPRLRSDAWRCGRPRRCPDPPQARGDSLLRGDGVHGRRVAARLRGSRRRARSGSVLIASRPPMRGLAGVGCALTRRAPKAVQGCLCPRASAAIHSDSASAPQPLPVESLSGGFKASAAGPAPARPVGRAFRRPGRGLAGDAAPPAAPIPAASLPLVCARNGSRRAAGLHGPLPRTRWCRERAEALPKQPRVARPAPRSRGSSSFPPSAPPSLSARRGNPVQRSFA